jgi:hypothetical protein
MEGLQVPEVRLGHQLLREFLDVLLGVCCFFPGNLRLENSHVL